MKTLLTILVILTCSKAFGQGTNRQLPKPTQDLIKNESTIDKGLNYLENSFKTVGSKMVLKTFVDCKENCTCSWEQQFDSGITYKYNDCHESGFDVVISFQGYDTKDVIKLVDFLFKTDDNVWNKEKTEYKPKDGGAGCYYKIRREEGVAILDYYCGC